MLDGEGEGVRFELRGGLMVRRCCEREGTDEDEDGLGGVTMEEPRITKSLILPWPTVNLLCWVT